MLAMTFVFVVFVIKVGRNEIKNGKWDADVHVEAECPFLGWDD